LLTAGTVGAGFASAADEVPQTALNVLKYVEANDGAAPAGYVGGRTFGNYEGLLPRGDSSGDPISYKEYDVNPFQKGVDRGGERLVVGSDGSAYFTNDHYSSFTPVG
jgi:ribonuclease T1